VAEPPDTPEPPNSGPVVDLYEHHRAEIGRFFAQARLHGQSIEDLVQEVYVRMLMYPPPHDLKEPTSYLYKVAWNVLHDARQRAARQSKIVHCEPGALEHFAVGQADSLSAEDCASESELPEEFMRALSEVPAVQQAAILLQRRDGLSYQQIAVRLRVSPNTVKKYLVRAMKHIKRRVNEARGPKAR
jgi:RNA polymerase sigma factor (sigma-70 family)